MERQDSMAMSQKASVISADPTQSTDSHTFHLTDRSLMPMRDKAVLAMLTTVEEVEDAGIEDEDGVPMARTKTGKLIPLSECSKGKLRKKGRQDGLKKARSGASSATGQGMTEVEFWRRQIADLSQDEHKKCPSKVVPDGCPLEEEHTHWQDRVDQLSIPTPGGSSIVNHFPPKGATPDEENAYWKRKMQEHCISTNELITKNETKFEEVRRGRHFWSIRAGLDAASQAELLAWAEKYPGTKKSILRSRSEAPKKFERKSARWSTQVDQSEEAKVARASKTRASSEGRPALSEGSPAQRRAQSRDKLQAKEKAQSAEAQSAEDANQPSNPRTRAAVHLQTADPTKVNLQEYYPEERGMEKIYTEDLSQDLKSRNNL